MKSYRVSLWKPCDELLQRSIVCNLRFIYSNAAKFCQHFSFVSFLSVDFRENAIFRFDHAILKTFKGALRHRVEMKVRGMSDPFRLQSGVWVTMQWPAQHWETEKSASRKLLLWPRGNKNGPYLGGPGKQKILARKYKKYVLTCQANIAAEFDWRNRQLHYITVNLVSTF